MTYFVRWKRNQVAIYEYFEPAKGRWVSCERAMLDFWLREGHAIHMNPRFDPIRYLTEARDV